MKKLFLFTTVILLTSFSAKNLECGDLLAKYGTSTQNLEFIDCHEGTGQTILEAKYKVSGENSVQIEKFLIEQYGLGELKFACCGWESKKGKNGYLDSEELKKIDSNYTLEISMYGNAEKIDDHGASYLEQDRTKVDFIVTVRLLDV